MDWQTLVTRPPEGRAAAGAGAPPHLIASFDILDPVATSFLNAVATSAFAALRCRAGEMRDAFSRHDPGKQKPPEAVRSRLVSRPLHLCQYVHPHFPQDVTDAARANARAVEHRGK